MVLHWLCNTICELQRPGRNIKLWFILSYSCGIYIRSCFVQEYPVISKMCLLGRPMEHYQCLIWLFLPLLRLSLDVSLHISFSDNSSRLFTCSQNFPSTAISGFNLSLPLSLSLCISLSQLICSISPFPPR